MKEDNKLYGKSILLNDERDIIDEDNDTSAFNDMNKYSDTEIESFRNELKNNSNNDKIKEKVYTDEMSGIKSSKRIIEDIKDKSLDSLIDRKDKHGKTMSDAGINLIQDLIGSKPNSDEINGINSFFRTLNDINEIYNYSNDELRVILGPRICKAMDEYKDDLDVSEYEATTRLMLQLYSSFRPLIQFNDDVDELSDILTLIGNMNEDDVANGNDEKVNDTLVTAINKLNQIDERTKNLKNEYKVTDYDILVVNKLKDCLQSAISFKKIYDKIDNSSIKKIRKDIKDENKINKSIENWINSIRNDEETLFSFPVSDQLSISESRKALIEYFTSILVLYLIESDNISIPDTVDKLDEYLIDSGYVTNKDFKLMRYKSTLFVYILSRVFKHKKIVTNDDRRVLSYTLDMLSKLSILDYRNRFMECVNYIYNKVG